MNWFLFYRRPDAPAAGAASADAGTQPGTASATLDLPPAKDQNADKGAAPAASSFVIPEAYKDKPYLKGVDSQDKLFVMLDGAQTLIGKRPAGIPAQDAPQEEWDKFYEAAGRPKEAKDYVFDGADKADPKFLPRVQNAIHKAGLNGSQAKVLWKEIGGALNEYAKEKGLDIQRDDVNFDELAGKTFGIDRDKILANGKSLIDKYAPVDMKPLVAKLSNENLILLAGVLNNISKTYIKEDGAPGGSPKDTTITPSEISAKARELMMKPEYSDPMHPGHDAIVKQVTDLYAPLRKK